MSERLYSIVMHTPIGLKRGTLTVKVSGKYMKGWLDVLGHREPIAGMIDSEGKCSFTGTFTTLMRKVSYKATGVLTESDAHLQIKDERNVYDIIGGLCVTEEKQI